MDLAFSLIAFGGHTAICVWLFNRLHAMPWPCWTIRILERSILAFAAAVIVVYGWRWWVTGVTIYAGSSSIPWHGWWIAYPLVSMVAAAAALPLWLIPKVMQQPPNALQSNHSARVNLARKLGAQPVGTHITALFASIPGNEIFSLAVQTK